MSNISRLDLWPGSWRRMIPAVRPAPRLLLSISLVLVAALLTPPAGRPVGAAAPPFVDAAAETGLTFTHRNGAAGRFAIVEIMGAGVALVDYDNDGDLDVFLVQGGALDAARGAQSRLFRNDLAVTASGTRTLRFTDVTDKAGLTPHGYGMGVAAGDYDNDDDTDLYVTAFGSNALYRNNGNGSFTDVTAQAKVDDPRWSASAAFADYDRDGDLDLFVVNYLDFTLAGNKLCYDPTGARDYCGPRSFQPVPARLFRNDGDGTFTDVSGAAGVARAYGAGLGVSVGDYNGDGWLDLYVANDATPNQLWINQKNGAFVDEGPLSGAAVNAAGNPEGSMGIASGDYDGDGDEDLFVTNIIGETFALYQNDGRGNFDDARVRAGLAQPTAAFTGFGAEWLDYDNDGQLDLFAANGAVNIVERLRGQPVPFRMRNLLFRNTGDGRFRETGAEGGPAFAEEAVYRGAAFGDIDNDGDTDIVVTINDGPVRLLLNQGARDRHWLQLRLQQPGGNRAALGARVGVERAGQPTLWRRVRTDGSYLSASDPRIHVGLGASPRVDGVIVEWPGGSRERFAVEAVDRLLILRRGSGKEQ
jgi:enediyne biosynthesis protein E4